MTTTIGSLLDIMARHMLETDRTFNSGLWAQEEVIYALGLLDQDFLQETGIVKKAGAVLVTAPGTLTYDEPADSIDVERLSYNGRKLYPQTRFELDRQNPSWRAATGRNPRRFHRDSLPNDQFQVWPAPTVADTGWTVSGRYGTVRRISGRTYSITGRYGVIRSMCGATNYFIGAWPTTTQAMYRGTVRRTLTTSTNFLLLHDLLGPTQTGVCDYLFTPDAFARYVMYGAMGRLWDKEGDGQDLVRARYCWERYARGAWLAKRLIYGDIEEEQKR